MRPCGEWKKHLGEQRKILMKTGLKNLGSSEFQAIDAQASVLMKRGIGLLAANRPDSAAQALVLFDSALELRRRLPVETVPLFAYGLAACWLNRAEVLMRLPSADGGNAVAALHAYDEAIRLLRNLPFDENAKIPRRLAIAYQNRGLALQFQGRSGIAAVCTAFFDAIAVLDHAESALIPDRQYLQGAVWSNLANTWACASDAGSLALARNAARRAIALVSDLEMNDANAAEVGLKARHVLCQTVALTLSQGTTKGETDLDTVHEATDAADDGLALARYWEQKGVARFRDIACDLFRFGALVYARFQPHFVDEFVGDNLDVTR